MEISELRTFRISLKQQENGITELLKALRKNFKLCLKEVYRQSFRENKSPESKSSSSAKTLAQNSRNEMNQIRRQHKQREAET